MKKRVCLFILLFCLLPLLPACASSVQTSTDADMETVSVSEEQLVDSDMETTSASEEQPAESDIEVSSATDDETAPELSERAQNWITDIHYLQSHYKRYHPDPFLFCSEEDFDYKIDKLCKTVESLSDNEIFFELATIIAGMGDLHTSLTPPYSIYEYLFPFGVSYFDGKLYVSSYMEGYDQFEPYMLREIVAVNGVDISYLEEKFKNLIDPNNIWRSREIFCVAYFVPAFFDWAGCDYQTGYTFQILDENQKVQSVEAPLVQYDDMTAAQIIYPESWASSLSAEEGNWTEYREGENGGYIYMNLEQLESRSNDIYRALFEKTAELIKAHPDCYKLVIDLRRNSGGYLGAVDFMREDVQILKELSIDQIYVLINGYTASAAVGCLSVFKEELNAVTAGEPTGQFTSFFYHRLSMNLVLPLSQLPVSLSTGWYEGYNYAGAVYDEDGKLYEWENTVLPDVYIHQDIEDIRQGKNSALEWVLKQ